MIYLHTATASLILFTIALLAGKKKSLSDYILVFWLLLLLSNMTAFFIMAAYSAPFTLLNSFLLEFSDTVTFLYGPIFWFYTLSLTKPDFRFKSFDWIHLLPFISLGILKLFVGLHYDDRFIHIVKVVALLKFISLLVYSIFVFRLVREHQRTIKLIFSNLESRRLDWLKYLSLGIIALWFIAFLSSILELLSFSNKYGYDGLVFQVAFDSFIITMTYFGFQQQDVYVVVRENLGKNEDIYSVDGPAHKDVGRDKLSSVKYQKSGLNEKHSKEIHTELMNLIINSEVYKNEDLTLYSLAELLNVSPNYLSQVINSIEKRSFFDFINFHRVEAVKKSISLKEKENITILGIAYESGFNSKAAFHRAFKKFVGMTPTEYKRARLDSD
jgi:AraC-like DNA-binding protein